MNQLSTTTQNTMPATNMADRFAALEAKAAKPAAQVWQPSEGDTLIGVISGSETVQHPMYGQQLQMLITTQAGEVVKVWLNRWLRDNLRGQNAEQGDMIALRFDGKRTTTKGQSFNAYHLIVDKQ